MNNILKVAYGHKKNNKTIHLTLGGLGITALSDLLEGDFQIYKGKKFQTRFSIIPFENNFLDQIKTTGWKAGVITLL
jgi:hypothetical protein